MSEGLPVRLCISIINHSNPELLLGCLRSLFSGTRVSVEVWVVDNATDGRLVNEIQQEFPTVKWLFNSRRLGFSANHNQVLRTVKAEYYCILNDDILLKPSCMDRLVDYLVAHPKVAMVGPRILNPDGTIQDSTFYDQSVWNELVGLLLLPRKLSYLKQSYIDAAQFGEISKEVQCLLGACIVIGRPALEQIGYLDEVLSPIANNEDVDWCLRARQADWAVVFCPEAELIHFGGQSQRTASGDINRFRVEMMRTRIEFFKKHHGTFRSLLLRAICVLTLPWNLLMLFQARLRGSLDAISFKGNVRTLMEIAKMSLNPQAWNF